MARGGATAAAAAVVVAVAVAPQKCAASFLRVVDAM